MVRTNQAPLRLIGYWAGPAAPDWPDPRDFVDPGWAEHARGTVIEYLARGF